MIKVEFTSTFDSPKHFFAICKELGISYKIDLDYKPHFYGCDAPDVGYIVDTDDFTALRNKATKEMYVENLFMY